MHAFIKVCGDACLIMTLQSNLMAQNTKHRTPRLIYDIQAHRTRPENHKINNKSISNQEVMNQCKATMSFIIKKNHGKVI